MSLLSDECGDRNLVFSKADMNIELIDHRVFFGYSKKEIREILAFEKFYRGIDSNPQIRNLSNVINLSK